MSKSHVKDFLQVNGSPYTKKLRGATMPTCAIKLEDALNKLLKTAATAEADHNNICLSSFSDVLLGRRCSSSH
jgi:hypothetical protein